MNDTERMWRVLTSCGYDETARAWLRYKHTGKFWFGRQQLEELKEACEILYNREQYEGDAMLKRVLP